MNHMDFMTFADVFFGANPSAVAEQIKGYSNGGYKVKTIPKVCRKDMYGGKCLAEEHNLKCCNQLKFECWLKPFKPNFTNHTGNAIDYPN